MTTFSQTFIILIAYFSIVFKLGVLDIYIENQGCLSVYLLLVSLFIVIGTYIILPFMGIRNKLSIENREKIYIIVDVLFLAIIIICIIKGNVNKSMIVLLIFPIYMIGSRVKNIIRFMKQRYNE